jgi:hypothetical protein
MTVIIHSQSFNLGYDGNISMKQLNVFIVLLFVSAMVFAQASGITELPESYRTPLSDMVYEDLTEWRVEPEDEYAWREGAEEPLIKPRLRVDLFPRYNYDSLQNPVSDSLFQNQNEIERPVSNILEYKFK